MKICTTVDQWVSFRKANPNAKTVGFVPTMGAIHAGHLSLLDRAKKENDIAVLSIFINPTQFNNQEDFAHYPKDLESDLNVLKDAGCPCVFVPEISEVYPNGVQPNSYPLGGLDTTLEGALRPGHFQGVATVVDRLFQMLKPDNAYFGEKDYQQVKVIEQLVKGLKGAPKIVSCRTLREPNGLAMSSRNRRLSAAQKELAATVFRALQFAESEIAQFPVPPQALIHEMKRGIEKAEELIVERIYFALAESLRPIEDMERPLDTYTEPVQCFISVFAGGVRLIDTHRVVPAPRKTSV